MDPRAFITRMVRPKYIFLYLTNIFLFLDGIKESFKLVITLQQWQWRAIS